MSELDEALQAKVNVINHISKCQDVYKKIEDFILEKGKKENNTINFDMENVSSEECFKLVEELIETVLGV